MGGGRRCEGDAMNMVEVHVLKIGTIERDEADNILDASSSSTLLVAGERRLVVDTSMPRDAEAIEEALAGNGLTLDEVDTVVNTHCHHDHTGGNRLFPHATVVIHKLEGAARSSGGPVLRVEGDTQLVPGVRVIETPGHTPGSISVVADTLEGVWVMSGDALPTLDNFIAWVPPGINYDQVLALKSMARIVDLARFIVPGHGAPFDKEGELPRSVMNYFR